MSRVRLLQNKKCHVTDCTETVQPSRNKTVIARLLLTRAAMANYFQSYTKFCEFVLPSVCLSFCPRRWGFLLAAAMGLKLGTLT